MPPESEECPGQSQGNVFRNQLTIEVEPFTQFFFEELFFGWNDNAVMQSKKNQKKQRDGKRLRKENHPQSDQQVAHMDRVADISVRACGNELWGLGSA